MAEPTTSEIPNSNQSPFQKLGNKLKGKLTRREVIQATLIGTGALTLACSSVPVVADAVKKTAEAGKAGVYNPEVQDLDVSIRRAAFRLDVDCGDTTQGGSGIVIGISQDQGDKYNVYIATARHVMWNMREVKMVNWDKITFPWTRNIYGQDTNFEILKGNSDNPVAVLRVGVSKEVYDKFTENNFFGLEICDFEKLSEGERQSLMSLSYPKDAQGKPILAHLTYAKTERESTLTASNGVDTETVPELLVLKGDAELIQNQSSGAGILNGKRVVGIIIGGADNKEAYAVSAKLITDILTDHNITLTTSKTAKLNRRQMFESVASYGAKVLNSHLI